MDKTSKPLLLNNYKYTAQAYQNFLPLQLPDIAKIKENSLRYGRNNTAMYSKNLGINLRTTGEQRIESGRTTRLQMNELRIRAASSSNSEKIIALLKLLGNAFSACMHSLTLQNIKTVKPMCENYGHSLKIGGWNGQWPACADCGCAITDTAMLRKSSIR